MSVGAFLDISQKPTGASLSKQEFIIRIWRGIAESKGKHTARSQQPPRTRPRLASCPSVCFSVFVLFFSHCGPTPLSRRCDCREPAHSQTAAQKRELPGKGLGSVQCPLVMGQSWLAGWGHHRHLLGAPPISRGGIFFSLYVQGDSSMNVCCNSEMKGEQKVLNCKSQKWVPVQSTAFCAEMLEV